jgi:cell fate regulator YaaT (PSP1 superfamily)
MDIAGIRLRGVCKTFHFDCTGVSVRKGDFAVVQTERGVALGEVVQRIDGYEANASKPPSSKVLRPASAEDVRNHQENARREAEAETFCERRIAERGLPMKLVRAEYLLDRSKAVFYFTADGRIDFRELVKDLAHELRTRIEMRQIGVRDEARVVGGVGPCGKELCCATFLRDFEPITVKMAKDQRLSLNPAKLSGVCGRLMCCLIYEHDSYARQKSCAPCAAEKAPLPPPDAAEPGDEELAARLEDDEEGTP